MPHATSNTCAQDRHSTLVVERKNIPLAVTTAPKYGALLLSFASKFARAPRLSAGARVGIRKKRRKYSTAHCLRGDAQPTRGASTSMRLEPKRIFEVLGRDRHETVVVETQLIDKLLVLLTV